MAGFPLTAGFFSKDEILLEAFGYNKVIFWMAAASAFCTAFYMARLWLSVFTGKPRAMNTNLSMRMSRRATITVPLMILALFALFAGWLGTPWLAGNWMHGFLMGGHELALPGAEHALAPIAHGVRARPPVTCQ